MTMAETILLKRPYFLLLAHSLAQCSTAQSSHCFTGSDFNLAAYRASAKTQGLKRSTKAGGFSGIHVVLLKVLPELTTFSTQRS